MLLPVLLGARKFSGFGQHVFSQICKEAFLNTNKVYIIHSKIVIHLT